MLCDLYPDFAWDFPRGGSTTQKILTRKNTKEEMPRRKGPGNRSGYLPGILLAVKDYRTGN